MPKKNQNIQDTDIINSKNEKIVKEFEKLINQIKIQIDIAPSTNEYMTNHFRLKQISNALEIIKKFPKEIKHGSELKDIKGIGKGTIDRIDEIIKSGKLSEIKVKKTDKKYSDYIEELQKIHGIGHTKAYELVTKFNIKSIAELKKSYNDGIIELNNVILTGLKYHDIYQEKIPRSEIDKIYEYLINKAKILDPDLKITICGSYRRMKSVSNDIDVLITHPKIKTKLQLKQQLDDNYLITFVKQLKEAKFILDDLTDKDYEIKYMGYCQLTINKHKYPIRRIDIRYIPYESYPLALLYFTGSATFNKRMRSLADQLGYTLNEYGLYKLTDTNKVKVKIESEKDVFLKLGMEYLPPDKRN
jgi:DNA polymerase/3'-5' exonuclease PolX